MDLIKGFKQKKPFIKDLRKVYIPLPPPILMEEKNMKCENCDYEWQTKSKMKYVNCPNCMRKTKNKEKESKKK